MISGKRGFEPVPKLYKYFPDHALCMVEQMSGKHPLGTRDKN